MKLKAENLFKIDVKFILFHIGSVIFCWGFSIAFIWFRNKICWQDISIHVFESRCILCQFSAVSFSFTRASWLEQCPVVCNSAKYITSMYRRRIYMRPVVTDREHWSTHWSTHWSQPSVRGSSILRRQYQSLTIIGKENSS